jgi:signal transduction histidine kinase
VKNLPSDSIFIKLLGAYGAAFLIILAGAVAVHVFASSVPNIDVSLDNVRYYSEGLAAEIGIPPSAEAARRIADETGLDIAILGPDFEWSNDEDLLDKARRSPGNEDFERFRFPEIGDWMVRLNSGRYRFFFAEFHADLRSSFLIWILMSINVAIALAWSYFMVRLLLKPLRDMDAVAREFGVSDWKRRTAPRGNDELARLGRTMNGMADRMEDYVASMHELIAAISHEFRSPLTRMKVALELTDDRRLKESLSEEIGALDRLTGTLLEQKRIAAGAGSLRLEPVFLGGWLAEACAPYGQLAAPIVPEVRGQDVRVRIDPARMTMAVRNLVENALRHAPGSPISVVARTGGGQASIEVSDLGPGMPEAILKRIGEPFLLGERSRTGDRSEGGFGLGLSIVKAVAEAHGARFEARNTEPRGFSVRITLRGE